jgi:hypothetical protein
VIGFIVASLMALAAADQTPRVVAAPDTPVRLESTKLLNAGADPLVLLYGARNVTESPLEVFTVMVFVFDKDGQLKARQVAPGRRELAPNELKHSAMVLDVGTIDPTDTILVGVDQAQRAGSESWWRAELRPLAQSTIDAEHAAAPARRR